MILIKYLSSGEGNILPWPGFLSLFPTFRKVVYPVQIDETKIESHSSLTKCIKGIKNGLSIRLAEIIYSLNAASLCFNLKETGSEELINLYPESCTN